MGSSPFWLTVQPGGSLAQSRTTSLEYLPVHRLHYYALDDYALAGWLGQNSRGDFSVQPPTVGGVAQQLAGSSPSILGTQILPKWPEASPVARSTWAATLNISFRQFVSEYNPPYHFLTRGKGLHGLYYLTFKTVASP